MTAFEAYCTYLAVKRHFSNDTYDYFRYNGVINASRESFEARKDIMKFQKLSRYKYPLPEYLATIFRDDPKAWVGTVASADSEIKYLAYRKIIESITYTWGNQLEEIGSVNHALKVPENGNQPRIITLHQSGSIYLETMIILDDLSNFSERFNQKMVDNPIWNDIEFKLRKFRPFMGRYDRKKMADILKNHLASYK